MTRLARHLGTIILRALGPGGVHLLGIMGLCVLGCCAGTCLLSGCGEPSDFWDWLGHQMYIARDAQDCTWDPPGTVSEGWGFYCGNISPTGWCVGTAIYHPAFDACEIGYCKQTGIASVKGHELAHCMCERIGMDAADGSPCMREAEA